MLILAVVGYAGLLDFGIGRAVTRRVAQYHASRTGYGTGSIVGTALAMLGLVAAILCVSLIIGADRIAQLFSGNNDKLVREFASSLRLAAIAFPLVLASQTFRGVLEGAQRFDLVNWVSIPTGASSYILAVAGWGVGESLEFVVAGVLLSRILGTLGFWLACYQTEGWQPLARALSASEARTIAGYGGWLSVSSFVGPVMVYLDRFAIASVLGPASSSIYSTVQEILFKFWLVPAAVTAVTFPGYVRSVATAGGNPSQIVAYSAVLIVAILCLPMCVLYVFGPELLAAWLRVDVDSEVIAVIRIFTIGVFINCVVQVLFTAVQADGKPRLTAMLHLLELPAYIAVLLWSIGALGIVGAALTWLLRIIVDGVALALVAVNICKLSSSVIWRIVFLVSLCLAVMQLALFIDSLLPRILASIVVASFCGFACYVMLRRYSADIRAR